MRGATTCAVIGVVLCAAPGCTTANPAFDNAGDGSSGAETTGSTGRPGSHTSSPMSEGTSGGQQDGTSGGLETGSLATGSLETSGSGTTAEPPPSCGPSPNDGLVLGLGDPSYTGNTCPTGFGFWAVQSTGGKGEPVLQSCLDGCTGCSGAIPYETAGLTLQSYLPDEPSACLRVEATTLLGDDGALCYWGALSVFDPATNAPYFVATTASAAPTPIAQAFLGEAIPDPEPWKFCACDRLPDPSVCCETTMDDAAFWAYSVGGELVPPGGSVLLPSPAPNGDSLSFEVFQAQSIPACDGDPLRLSWAVVPAS